MTELLAYPPGLLVPGQSEAVVLEDMLARGHFGSGEQAKAQADMLANLDRSKPYRRQLVTPANRVLDTRSDPTPGGGWVTTFTDVTEAEAVQNELRRAKEVAEAANQAKSRFLATMSHELRTPLNVVIGFSDALLQESPNPSRAQIDDYAQQIKEAGHHLLGLINSILDVARIEFRALRLRRRRSGRRAPGAKRCPPVRRVSAGGRDRSADRSARRTACDPR